MRLVLSQRAPIRAPSSSSLVAARRDCCRAKLRKACVSERYKFRTARSDSTAAFQALERWKGKRGYTALPPSRALHAKSSSAQLELERGQESGVRTITH